MRRRVSAPLLSLLLTVLPVAEVCRNPCLPVFGRRVVARKLVSVVVEEAS